MKLILGTGNVMTSGHPTVRRHLFAKSNIELINGLKSNIQINQDKSGPSEGSHERWTTRDADTLYVPSRRSTPLTEPRVSYDITVKLFFLPNISAAQRSEHLREAIDMVLNELAVNGVDLIIVSFPGISFDAEDETETLNDQTSERDEVEDTEAQVRVWKAMEELHEQGKVNQLGLAEFSAERLSKFIPRVKIPPMVDQINVRDCCVVPRDLIIYAKEHQIELLTHNDCTDILPAGTTRDLLGPGGADILAAQPDATGPGLAGDIAPQWVVKYTAVVKDRGVVENKGYIAAASLGSCITI